MLQERGKSMSGEAVLTWKRFKRMTEACKEFKLKSCIYVIADSSETPLYIGEAAGRDGLDGRYRGGTASAVDAALHESGNLIFVTPVPNKECRTIEQALIYAEQPLYNRQGKIVPLSSVSADSILHRGDVPRFTHRQGLGKTSSGNRP